MNVQITGKTDFEIEKTPDRRELLADVAVACGFSVYDSMIVASALVAGCETFYSADLQDRQVIDGTLTIVNPFNTPAPAA